LQKNVFDLGATYKKLVKAIDLKENDELPLIQIEPLIYKFATRLEFGHATRLVANDAALILARMNRDWMVTGRQPQALCGAALILAARMNNFRRTAREVVYVVKAGELKEQHDPPSVYQAREREEKKRKRTEYVDTESITTGEPQEALEGRDGTSRPSKRARIDKDGFAIPEIPIDPALGRTTRKRTAQAAQAAQEAQEAQEARRTSPSPSMEPQGSEDGAPDERPKKRRKKKSKPEPVVIAEEELLAEGELEAEISNVVERHLDTDEVFELTYARAKAIAATEMAARAQNTEVPDHEVIDDEEFDSDPEVANCLLSAGEVEVKEKIWVTHNHQWLRQQQERLLDKAMDEARGKKKRQNKRKPKASDLLNETPASSPAEASQRMLERRNVRAAFSKHINYDRLKSIYSMDSESNKDTDSSKSTSPVPSHSVATPSAHGTPRFQIGRTRVQEKDDEPIETESDQGSEDQDDDSVGLGAEDDSSEDDPVDEEDLNYDELAMDDSFFERLRHQQPN